MATTKTKRLWLVLGCLTAVVVLAVVGLAVALGGGGSKAAGPRDAARAYLDAWQSQRWPALAAMIGDAPGRSVPAAATAAYRAQLKAFGATGVTIRLGRGHANPNGWTGRFTASFHVPGTGVVSYPGSLTLARDRQRAWKVAWSPATVHPALTKGGTFAVDRVFPPRAAIVGVDSTPLTVDAQVVDVGLVPERIKDRAGLEAALQRSIGVTPQDVESKLTAPGVQPSYFVPITTISSAQYDAVAPAIYPLPGTAFRKHTSRTAASPQLAAHVVGRTGPITAEILKELGAGYTATDIVGLSGLERTYERRLAGTPGRAFVVRDAKGATVATIRDLPGTPGQAVRTTIDLRTQQAAEAALANTAAPAALVALAPSTGELRAIVSTPVSAEFDRALDGRYPPGSTFKIVTTAALLANGSTPSTPTTCPTTLTVDGRVFHNFEGEGQPNLTLARAFAISCNTAFLQMGQKLPDDALARAATSLGFDARPDLPLAALGGSVPSPTSQTERAAAAIGQGKVTVSPLSMATVAGAVGAGTWNPSKLVLDPAPAKIGPPRPIDPSIADALRSLMSGVVASGTGTAAAVPGRAVAGKTGTAEFGSGENPPTHAWFVGYSGDLAFSVLVEGGGVGGRVAAPIAAQFLRVAP